MHIIDRHLRTPLHTALRRQRCRIGAALVLLASFVSQYAMAASFATGTISDARFYSAALGANSDYKIYQPVGYSSANKTYPVLYLLHGRGDNYQAWTRIQQVLDELIATAQISPCLVVMPDAPSSKRASFYVDSAYSGSDNPGKKVETALMMDLIPHIDATYRTMAQRSSRAIGGYSMGGYGAMRLALAYPEQFAAALVLSPATYVPLPPADSSTRTFGAFGSGPALFVEAIYQAKNYPALLAPFAQKNLPVHFFIATGDDEYKNKSPDEAHDIDLETHLLFSKLVRTTNATAELRIINGVHDWAAWDPLFREGVRDIFRKLQWSPSR